MGDNRRHPRQYRYAPRDYRMTRTAPSGQTRSPTNYQMRLSSDLRANSQRYEGNWTSTKPGCRAGISSQVDAMRIADHASQEYPARIVGLVFYASGHVTKKQDRKNEERKRCQ